MDMITTEVLKSIVSDLAQKTGKSETYLYELLATSKEEVSREKSLTGDALVEAAIIRTKKKVIPMLYRGNVITGIVLGQGVLKDYLEMRKQKALRLWKTDPEKARNEGLVNDDGTPIDSRESIFFKGGEIDNPFRGMPIDAIPKNEREGNVEREIPLLSNGKIIRVKAKGEKARAIVVPILAQVTFEGRMSEKYPDQCSLFSSQFTTTSNSTLIDVIPQIKDVEPLKAIEGKENCLVLFEAVVFDVIRKEGSTAILLGDFDASYQITATFPADYPLPLGLESRVICYGTKRSYTVKRGITHVLDGLFILLKVPSLKTPATGKIETTSPSAPPTPEDILRGIIQGS